MYLSFRATGFTTRSDIGPAREATDIRLVRANQTPTKPALGIKKSQMLKLFFLKL